MENSSKLNDIITLLEQNAFPDKNECDYCSPYYDYTVNDDIEEILFPDDRKNRQLRNYHRGGASFALNYMSDMGVLFRVLDGFSDWLFNLEKNDSELYIVTMRSSKWKKTITVAAMFPATAIIQSVLEAKQYEQN